MSDRGGARSRGFSRGRHESSSHDSSYNTGRGYRGRGFTNVSHPPPIPISSPAVSCNVDAHKSDNIKQDEKQSASPPQPIFTPQPKLDLYTQTFLEGLRKVWDLWKKSKNVSRMLQEYFSTVQNPYQAAFNVAVTCPDFYQGKPVSLPVAVIEELAVFLKNRESEFALCLTTNIKFDVFDTFTKQRNSLFTKLAFEVYQLPVEKNLFVDSIKTFIKNQQYKEACQTATYLGLDQFNVENFVLPLIFQDKLTIAEDFLKTSAGAQIATVEYLDRLLQGRVSAHIDEVIRRLQIQDLKRDKLQYKPLSKLLARFIKIFNVPPSTCPNLTLKRREGALQFVIRKRYKFQEIEGECWREMVTEAVCGDPFLEEELVHSVNQHGDVAEAAFFAVKFELPLHKLPYNVAMFMRSGNTTDEKDNSLKPVSSSEQQRPKRVLELPEDHTVSMVDTDEGLWKCSEALAQAHMVGIDCEWKPAFCADTETLSLLQIATLHETFLIDMNSLQTSPVWKELNSVLFANQNILKLGFGLATDMLKLQESILLSGIKMSGMGYLDLCVLWKKIMREFNLTLPYKDEESVNAEGLSRLVVLTLGVPLDKSEQFSNWDRRPLRDAQKYYAALDAFCLLQVYDVLSVECRNQEVPLLDIIFDIMSDFSTVKKPKKKKPSLKVKQENMIPGPNINPITVKDIRVVCDTMLQGLGRQLRTVGVDAEILGNMQNHDVCVAMCNEGNRVILTAGTVYDRLHSQVPQGMCYRVVKPNSKEQLVEVLDYYNVRVTKEDIFSRCQTCNSSEFKKMTPAELHRVIYSVRNSRPMTYYEVEDDEDNFDDVNYSDDSYSDDDLPGPPISVSPTAYNTQPHSHNACAPQPEEELSYGYGCLTNSGAHIKHEMIPKEKFNEVPLIYICDNCGHCYWDGSHLERLCDRLRDVVKM